jgi:hypothetical protein
MWKNGSTPWEKSHDKKEKNQDKHKKPPEKGNPLDKYGKEQRSVRFIM